MRRKDVLPFFASLGPCLIGMEACGSAHHWGRELMALGHEVKLIPPVYVKPFVKRQKNDRNDAAAIYEALFRPGLRFVAVRSIENQAMLMQHSDETPYGLVTVLRRSPERLELARGDRRDDQVFRRV